MIEVRHLRFDYPGKRALDDVGFTIEAGSITALVGPNGAGKTTLLRCLAALEEPYAGEIRIDGVDAIEAPRDAHARLGFLADDFGLYTDLTARQCLSYAARCRGFSGSAIDARVREVAAGLHLEDKLGERAGALSRGQRQRLALAQAIIHRPRVLLLDEPASGLDPEARTQLAALLRSLRAQGMTLVVSSHILAELEEYSTAMLVLRDGRVIEHRTLEQPPHARRLRIRLAEPAPEPAALAAAWPPSLPIDARHGSEIAAHFSGSDAELHECLRRLVERGVPVCEFALVEESLQDAYLATVHAAGRS